MLRLENAFLGKSVLVLSSILAATQAAGETVALHSASRLPGETYSKAVARYEARLLEVGIPPAETGSAHDEAGPFQNLEIQRAPTYQSLEEMTRAFVEGRDSRYMTTTGPVENRRPSWLYPDDGCFARASVFGQHLAAQGFVRPGKLFIFGNLRVATKNHPDGEVSWWYHVVPAARIGEALYVFDPAIDPTGPLLARDWAMTQVRDVADASFSLCNEFSYSPSDSCRQATDASDSRGRSDQQTYLSYEWDRQQELGRAAAWFLGEHPPWKD